MTTYQKAVKALIWLNENCMVDRFNNVTADYKGCKRECGGKFVHSQKVHVSIFGVDAGLMMDKSRIIDGHEVIKLAKRAGWQG